MKVEAKGEFEALRLDWEFRSAILERFKLCLVTVSSSNVKPSTAENTELAPYIQMTVEMPNNNGLLEITHGHILVFGQADSINIFSKAEFEANFQEVKSS